MEGKGKDGEDGDDVEEEEGKRGGRNVGDAEDGERAVVVFDEVYSIKDSLKRGPFVASYKCINRINGEWFVVKVINKSKLVGGGDGGEDNEERMKKICLSFLVPCPCPSSTASSFSATNYANTSSRSEDVKMRGKKQLTATTYRTTLLSCVPLLETYSTSDLLFCVFPFLPSCVPLFDEILDKVEKGGFIYSTQVVSFFFQQVLLAVNAFHTEKGLAIGFINEDTFVVNENKKLTLLGGVNGYNLLSSLPSYLINDSDDPDGKESYCLESWWYLSPQVKHEIISNSLLVTKRASRLNRESEAIENDVYSLGCLLFTLLTGFFYSSSSSGINASSSRRDNNGMMNRASSSSFSPLNEVDNEYGKDLIMRMTREEKNERCSLRDALGHPFIIHRGGGRVSRRRGPVKMQCITERDQATRQLKAQSQEHLQATITCLKRLNCWKKKRDEILEIMLSMKEEEEDEGEDEKEKKERLEGRKYEENKKDCGESINEEEEEERRGTSFYCFLTFLFKTIDSLYCSSSSILSNDDYEEEQEEGEGHVKGTLLERKKTKHEPRQKKREELSTLLLDVHILIKRLKESSRFNLLLVNCSSSSSSFLGARGMYFHQKRHQHQNQREKWKYLNQLKREFEEARDEETSKKEGRGRRKGEQVTFGSNNTREEIEEGETMRRRRRRRVEEEEEDEGEEGRQSLEWIISLAVNEKLLRKKQIRNSSSFLCLKPSLKGQREEGEDGGREGGINLVGDSEGGHYVDSREEVNNIEHLIASNAHLFWLLKTSLIIMDRVLRVNEEEEGEEEGGKSDPTSAPSQLRSEQQQREYERELMNELIKRGGEGDEGEDQQSKRYSGRIIGGRGRWGTGKDGDEEEEEEEEAENDNKGGCLPSSSSSKSVPINVKENPGREEILQQQQQHLSHEHQLIKEIRFTKRRREEKLGITLKVNDCGRVTVNRILVGGLIERQATLGIGDVLLEINGISLEGKSFSFLQQLLKQVEGEVNFKIIPHHHQQQQQQRGGKFNSRQQQQLMYECSSALGPASSSSLMRAKRVIWLRSCFDYEGERDEWLPCPGIGLSFKKRDILRIVDQSDMFWWQAIKEKRGEEEEEDGAGGLIPSPQLQEYRQKKCLEDEADDDDDDENGDDDGFNEEVEEEDGDCQDCDGGGGEGERRDQRKGDKNKTKKGKMKKKEMIKGKKKKKKRKKDEFNCKKSLVALSLKFTPSSYARNKQQRIMSEREGWFEGPLSSFNAMNSLDRIFYEEVIQVEGFRRKCLVLIGAHGVGRRHLKNSLLSLYPSSYSYPIPFTTRPPKKGEQEEGGVGANYHFISHQEMLSQLNNQQFLEYGTHQSFLYGTKLSTIQAIIEEEKKIAILDIEPQSLYALRNSTFAPLVVFIQAPPQPQPRSQGNNNNNTHCHQNTTTPPPTTCISLKRLLRESDYLLSSPSFSHLYDVVLINTDLNETIQQLHSLMTCLSSRTGGIVNSSLHSWLPLNWVYS